MPDQRLKHLVPAPARRVWQTLRLVRPEARSALVRLWLGGLARPEDSVPPLPKAPRILFVCYGNILRSAVAEALFVRLTGAPGDGTIASCGVGAVPGRPADPRGLRVAREMGADLSGHQARALTPQLAEPADLILVMDRLNAAELLTRLPGVRPRMRYLGAFAPRSPDWPEIPDPFMGNEDTVRSAFRTIEAAVRHLSDRIALAS